MGEQVRFVPLADIVCHGPGNHDGVNQRPPRCRVTAKLPAFRFQSSSLKAFVSVD
jgi:hypothetical protein